MSSRAFPLAAGLIVLLMVMTGHAMLAAGADKLWINPAGGFWNDGANWADGVPPSRTLPDNVTIEYAGVYQVDVDIPDPLFERLTLGGSSGEQTLDLRNLTARAFGAIDVHSSGVFRNRNVTVIALNQSIHNQGWWHGLEFNAVRSGGFTNLHNVTIEGGTSAFQGPFHNAPGALLEIDGILGNTTARFEQIVNSGSVHLRGSELAAINVTGSLTVEPGGVIEAQPGGLRSLFAPLLNYGLILINANTSLGRPGAPVFNGGQLSVVLDNVTFEGSAFTNQGELSIGRLRNVTFRSESYLDDPGAALRGAGTLYDESGVIRNVTCRLLPEGDADPGGTAPPYGVLTLVANPRLAAESRVQVDIGGLGAGVGHDQLAVGDVDLDGMLDVALAQGYHPSVGDEFHVVLWSGRTGRFRSITGLDLGGGLYLQPVYTPETLKLVTTTSPPIVDKVWVNPAGGLWSEGANWGDGTPPSNSILENVTIEYAGSYTVDLDVNATFGGLSLGGPSGSQTLRARYYNASATLDVEIGARGHLWLDNVTFETVSPSPSEPQPSIVNGGDVIIRNVTRMASGSFINNRNLTIEDATLDWDGALENYHNVTITGGSSNFNSYFRNVGNVTFDRSSSVFHGEFTNEAGADLRATSTCCRNASIRFEGPVSSSGRIQMGADKPYNNVTFESAHPFTIEPGGVLATEGDGIRSLFGPLVNRGALLINATFQLLATGTFHLNQGAIVLDRGNVTVSGALDNRGSIDIGGGKVLKVDLGYRDNVTALLRGSGTLDASGGIANVTGRIRPGTSPGVLQVLGDLALSSTSRVEIELGGLTAGTEHDQLAVSGHASLHGTLAVELIDGFMPQAGDSFVVMTYASQSGNFVTFEGTVLPNGLYLVLEQRPGSIVLRASATNAVGALVPREIEFRARTTRQAVWFELGLPRAAETRIDVFDVLGRAVGTIRDERREAGLHTVRWNASGLPSGAYFVRLRVREPGLAVDRRSRFLWVK